MLAEAGWPTGTNAIQSDGRRLVPAVKLTVIVPPLLTVVGLAVNAVGPGPLDAETVTALLVATSAAVSLAKYRNSY